MYPPSGYVPAIEPAVSGTRGRGAFAHVPFSRPRHGRSGHSDRQLTDVAAAFGVEELVVVTVCHVPKAHLRSYELVADAFGFAPCE